MTPEEKVNRDIWYTLQELKEEYLRTRKGELVEYWVDFDFVAANQPMPKNIEKSLEKLEESRAIEIINSGWDYE